VETNGGEKAWPLRSIPEPHRASTKIHTSLPRRSVYGNSRLGLSTCFYTVPDFFSKDGKDKEFPLRLSWQPMRFKSQLQHHISEPNRTIEKKAHLPRLTIHWQPTTTLTLAFLAGTPKKKYGSCVPITIQFGQHKSASAHSENAPHSCGSVYGGPRIEEALKVGMGLIAKSPYNVCCTER